MLVFLFVGAALVFPAFRGRVPALALGPDPGAPPVAVSLASIVGTVAGALALA